MSAPVWDAPGPGGWALDAAHSFGPVTPIVRAVLPGAMADGFRSWTGRYGIPVSHIDVAYVNGYPFGRVRIAGVPPSERPPPPQGLLRVLVRVHPELRRRDRAARRALDERPWRDDLDRWFRELRPARIASLTALQAVDPEALDDADLAAHVVACVDELASGLREHHSLAGAAGLPVGLHLLRQEARGRTHADALGDLAGAAAASTGATVPALAAVASALAAAGVEPRSLEDVAAASPAASTALAAYLDVYGQRVVGAFDVTGRRLVELPEVVLRSITDADLRPPDATGPGSQEAVDEDDPVLADARLAVASRDDHSGTSGLWPLGLTRRALLVAGARLHRSGALHEGHHVLEASVAEVRDLLARRSGAPSADELASRAAARAALAGIAVPASLGEVHPPADPAVFPSGLRRTAAAMGAFLAAMDVAHGSTGAAGEAEAVGVGTIVHRGRAVVAADPEDAITRVRPGDVLVTTTTTPAFNSILPVVGALVTVHGGAMGHAGIAARELGIPAVIGVADALTRLTDAAVVEVDPVAATVRPAPRHVAFGVGVPTPRVGVRDIGAKAAGLAEMGARGLPVPPGVVVPVSEVDEDSVREAVAHLEELTGCRLGDPDAPLVVSVRSGSAASMPGMLDTLLDVGTTPEVAEALGASTADPGFATDTRRRFLSGWAEVVGGEPPHDAVDQVVAAAAAVVASWRSERARTFREREGIEDDLGTSVTIQQMVFGNLGSDSGTAVVFSRDPSTGAPGMVGDLVIGGQGDEVVGGTRATRPIADMASLPSPWPEVHAELAATVAALERHHADLVDVEVTVERGRLHVLQCRPGRRSAAAAARIAVSMAQDPDLAVTRADAVARCRPLLDAPPAAAEPLPAALVDAHRLASGLAAGPGRGVGALVVSVEDALRRHDAGEAVVLVRPHTAPSDVAVLSVAAGVVTTTGGLVSHAALVARSWGVPAVVGASDVVVEGEGVRVGGRLLPSGTLVTVDGSAGVLLEGDHATGPSSEVPEVAVLRAWAAEAAHGASPVAPGAHRDVDDREVLHAVALRGRTTIDSLVAVTGAHRDAIAAALDRLAARDRVTVAGGSVTATSHGRADIAAEVAEVVAEHGVAMTDLLDRFVRPDRELKRLIGARQGGDGPADPTALIRERVHPEVVALLSDGAVRVPRLGRYAERLDAALDRLSGGDERFLAHPGVDSYHTIWFELHEDLIGLAGTDRDAEVAAGRA